MDVPTLMGAIEALRVQGLTRLVVVRTFIYHRIIVMRERTQPLWQHPTNPMMEFPYPISEELFRVLMIGAVGVEYLREGIRPPSFDAEHPLPRAIHSSGWCRSPLFPLQGWSGCG
jgi:hypothetical protein